MILRHAQLDALVLYYSYKTFNTTRSFMLFTFWQYHCSNSSKAAVGVHELGPYMPQCPNRAGGMSLWHGLGAPSKKPSPSCRFLDEHMS